MVKQLTPARGADLKPRLSPVRISLITGSVNSGSEMYKVLSKRYDPYDSAPASVNPCLSRNYISSRSPWKLFSKLRTKRCCPKKRNEPRQRSEGVLSASPGWPQRLRSRNVKHYDAAEPGLFLSHGGRNLHPAAPTLETMPLPKARCSCPSCALP